MRKKKQYLFVFDYLKKQQQRRRQEEKELALKSLVKKMLYYDELC